MKFFRIILLTLMLAIQLHVISQTESLPPLQPLSKADLKALSEIPELVLSPEVMKRSLPTFVDNSALPYMRPLFQQTGLSCGQASSIGVMFAYEINAERGVPGNLPVNQYATHFTYNFVNNGSDGGINFFETMQIVRDAGNPNVVDYSGDATGGASRWMSGYDKYYNAMKNRVGGIYRIRTNTLEGLNSLKQWIYDHGDGSPAGGMATFYSEFTSPPSTLPPGTPEAGKHVIYHWGSSPNHGMTIVGYHDGICWDYNNDGQYTRDIDLNGDGLIDVRDWEVGGFKMANTYGSISGWGDQGFSYMMYKTVADSYTEGGIWNAQVMVIEAKADYQPKLTARVSLTYPSRNKLKVMTGVSTDPLATEPEFVLQYPIFDFHDGDLPMQGSAGGNTIEFGLDMNKLLEHVEPGAHASFFLMVAENDANGSYSGTINSFSLMDYTSGSPVEIPANILLQPIQNNGLTTIGVTAAINYAPVSIATSEIPPFELYQPSEVQLQAEGGSQPYNWFLLDTYDSLQSTASFPVITGNPLTIVGGQDGMGTVELPFDFPFYGETHNKLYVTVDGFIMFEESLIPWPYYVAGKTYLMQNKFIAPTLSRPFYVNGSNGDGIWAEVLSDQATIRWKLSVSGQSGNSEVSMAARLHQNGEIEFFYGPHMAASYVARFAGISKGDNENMLLLNKLGYFSPQPGDYYKFTPQPRFNDVTLTSKGLLRALIDEPVPGMSVEVMVNDQNNIRNKASLALSVSGVVLNYSLNAGDDNVIEYGENVSFNMALENKTSNSLGAGTLTLSSEDTYLNILSGSTEIAALAPDQSLTLNDVFDVEVRTDVPNNHQAEATLHYSAPEGSWSRPIRLTAYAPVMKMLTVSISDGGNGILEPGETAGLVIRLRNAGGAKLLALEAAVSSADPDLSILNGTASWPQLLPGDIWEAVFQVSLDAGAEPVQVIELLLNVEAANDFSFNKTIPIMTSLIVEGFESGDFSAFDWEMSGDAPWIITGTTPFEGAYSARSGVIGDDQTSSMSIAYEVAFADTVSFFYKVSTENNYDYLRFYVNGIQKNEWDGEVPWSHAVYDVEAGENTFRWSYAKDYSVSSGSDCVWVDYIMFPAMKIYTSMPEQAELQLFELTVGPNPFESELQLKVKAKTDGPFKLMLTDARGVQYLSETFSAKRGDTFILQPEHTMLPTGLLFVVLQYGNQRIVKPLIHTGH